MWRTVMRGGTKGWGRLGGNLAVTISLYGGMSLLSLGHFAARSDAQSCSGGLTTERVSVATDGAQANDRSVTATSNANACVVAFKSYATNLIPNDRNEKVDVFVRDRVAATTVRVPALPASGSEPNDNSYPPALDATGRFIAFGSAATNLVLRDFNMSPDVFFYDTVNATNGSYTIVYDNQGDGLGGGGAPDLPPSLDGDGQIAAFASSADDLVANDRNEASDVFVNRNGVNELMSVATTGSSQGFSANGTSAGAAISNDGCVVAFYSDATNLVPADTNQVRDVFVRDRCQGITERVSVSSSGAQANAASQATGLPPAISGNGRFVAFASDASNLDSGDDNGLTDVFVRDRVMGTTTRVSKSASGASGNGPSQYPSLSLSGQFVAFQSAASNLVDDDTNGKTDIFVVDQNDSRVQLVSLSSSGAQGNGDSTAPTIATDGVSVIFQSDATNLVPDDTNGVTDIFASINQLSFSPTPTPTVPTPTPTAGDSCGAVCTAGQGCRRAVDGQVMPGVCLPEFNCECVVGGTPTVTPTRTVSPTVTVSTPPMTPTTTTPTPTLTPTAGDFCGTVCTVGQGCRRSVGGQVMPGVCVPEFNCECVVGGTATVTPPMGPSNTPTRTTSATTPTPAATATSGGGGGHGGGGCNCRIDPVTGSVADSLPLPAFVVPVLLWMWSRRQRRR